MIETTRFVTNIQMLTALIDKTDTNVIYFLSKMFFYKERCFCEQTYFFKDDGGYFIGVPYDGGGAFWRVGGW